VNLQHCVVNKNKPSTVGTEALHIVHCAGAPGDRMVHRVLIDAGESRFSKSQTRHVVNKNKDLCLLGQSVAISYSVASFELLSRGCRFKKSLISEDTTTSVF